MSDRDEPPEGEGAGDEGLISRFWKSPAPEAEPDPRPVGDQDAKPD